MPNAYKPVPNKDVKINKPDPRVLYKPRNQIATYTDDWGEERILHAPKGRAVRRFNGSDTPIQRMNRAVAIKLGENIRRRRQELGYSMRELCLRAGIICTNPKNYLKALETPVSTRAPAAMRMGTLFGLARALQCEPGDLLPSVAEVVAMSGVAEENVIVLCSGQINGSSRK